MSYPILYSATETNFDHNGIGILSACVSCEVTEEANGIFELAMQYPMDGVHFAEIGDRAIIKAKADQFRQPQLFRVYAISKPMNGIVTVLAEHISYDLSGIPVKPFSASTASSALIGLKNNAVVNCPFDFWTDKTTQANFKVSVPASIRSRLGGVAGSILDVYGGEYEFDNYTVKLHNHRGMNRGVSIRYGKNLTDIQQEQNCASVATGVYPYWSGDVDGNTVLVELPEKIVNAPGTYNFVEIRTLDLSAEFETQPTVEQLRKKTESYVKANNIGVPNVSLTVSFAQLEQYEEYKHLKFLERVSLFDSVNVEFPALGVSATAKAVKMKYDTLADRVKSVTLGSVRSNIADTIASQQQEIIYYSKDKPSVSLVQKISSSLAKSIMGANGGSVRLIDTNDDGEPDELYIADDPDQEKAVKVWRFNHNGWAVSDEGYNGPFVMGATIEDGLLADFVTAANLVAGSIQSKDGKTFYLDLDNGILKMQATELSISGKTMDAIAQEAADNAEDNAVEKAAVLANAAKAGAISAASSDATEKANAAKAGAISAASSDATEKANAALGNAKSYTDALNNSLTQTEIFNRLTENGALQGIFMQDGELYINGEYIKVDDLRALGATIGGWNIGIDSIYSDVSTESGTYRVYIQRYIPKYGADSWIYSVQKKNEETGKYNAIMYIRGDGKIYTPGFISDVEFEKSVSINGNASINGSASISFGLTCAGQGVFNNAVFAKGGIVIGPHNQLIRELRVGYCTLDDSERTTVTFASEMNENVSGVMVILTPRTETTGVIAGKVISEDRTGFVATIGGSDGISALFSYIAIGY